MIGDLPMSPPPESTMTAIEVDQPPPEIAAALGLSRNGGKRRKSDGRACEDCFFYRHMLCALDLDEPCSTFRADSPEGLRPPRQPALLPRS